MHTPPTSAAAGAATQTVPLVMYCHPVLQNMPVLSAAAFCPPNRCQAQTSAQVASCSEVFEDYTV
jgi:hypothetical protein